MTTEEFERIRKQLEETNMKNQQEKEDLNLDLSLPFSTPSNTGDLSIPRLEQPAYVEMASGTETIERDVLLDEQLMESFENIDSLPEIDIQAPILYPQKSELAEEAEEPVKKEKTPNDPVTSVSEVSFVRLKEEMDLILLSLYQGFRTEASDLFNESLTVTKTVDELYDTPIGKAFNEIYKVAAVYNGVINSDAVKAVNLLLPVLWQARLNQDYSIPETWYNTNLGFLCRYIKLGSIATHFDPIDMMTAANMLKVTEEQIISKMKDLAGVKVSNGMYIFSKQKVEDYIRGAGGTDKIREKEEELKQINHYLTKVSTISKSLELISNQIQMVHSALQSESLGKDPERLNALINQNIQKASREYGKLQVMVQELPTHPETYVLDPILDPIAKLGGVTITRDQYMLSVEESLAKVKVQLQRTSYVKEFLIQKLGECTIEITTLKLNLDI